MNRLICPLCLAVLFCFFPGSTHARPVHVFIPDELVQRSDVICNGIVTEIIVTEERSEKIWNANTKPFPTLIAVAKVKVIGLIHGDIPEEIEIRFPQLDPAAFPQGIVSGPINFDVEVGKRYRFFLRQMEGSSAFVGALDGSFDDGAAAEPLGPTESDTAPPVLLSQAAQTAKTYLFSRSPIGQYPDSRIIPEFLFQSCPATWKVTFYSREPSKYPASTSDAEVFVTGNGIVEADSWVANTFPVSGKLVDESYVGKRVRLTQIVMQPLREIRAPLAPTGEIKVLLGTVSKVDGPDVTGNFRVSGQAEGPKTMTISKAHIEGIQKLTQRTNSLLD